MGEGSIQSLVQMKRSQQTSGQHGLTEGDCDEESHGKRQKATTKGTCKGFNPGRYAKVSFKLAIVHSIKL